MFLLPAVYLAAVVWSEMIAGEHVILLGMLLVGASIVQAAGRIAAAIAYGIAENLKK